jgi:hypothetical protein
MDHISKGSDSWVGFCLNAETVREQKNFVKKHFSLFPYLKKERKAICKGRWDANPCKMLKTERLM